MEKRHQGDLEEIDGLLGEEEGVMNTFWKPVCSCVLWL